MLCTSAILPGADLCLSVQEGLSQALWERTVPYSLPFPALAQRLLHMILPRFVELATYWCPCEPEAGSVASCGGAQPSVDVCSCDIQNQTLAVEALEVIVG